MARQTAGARPRWTVPLAVLSATVLASVALLAGGGGLPGGAIALDELNPFGSVQDESLPAQLGQPPMLSAMLHTDYPPGFDRNGQPTGPADRLPPPPRQQMSYTPEERRLIDKMATTNTWREHRASSYPLYASSNAPPARSTGYDHPTPRGVFSGTTPTPGATKAERDFWSMAQGAYWRSLDHFYRAEAAGTNSDWIARRSGWASRGPEAAAHAASGDKILNQAKFFYNQGKRVAGGEQLAGAGARGAATGRNGGALEREAASAEREYMQALVYLDKSTKAGGGTTTADEWDKAQAHWDYFYQTNRVLDGKQQVLDAKRAEALRQYLPRGDSSAAVKIDAYVAPWRPFPACAQSTHSTPSRSRTRALRALRRLSALHALRHPTPARHGDLEAVCYAADALRAPTSPIAFTPRASVEGQTLQQQVQRIKSARGSRGRDAHAEPAQKDADAEGQQERERVQKELDAAMAPLNLEQARLNRAKMILYVKQFGPIRALFSGKAAAKKSSLWFPGDFEQPRNDDCDTPGACHDWADGAYIDSFAAAVTNWDSMGQPTPGYLHWDTMADDTWEGPHDTVRDGGNPNVRWRSARTQELLQMPSTVADESFDWKGFNEQQLKLQERAQDAAQVLMSPALQNYGPAKLLGNPPVPTTRLQVGGKGGWFETHASTSAGATSASGMLGVNEGWTPPKGLPFGGNIASKPLSGIPAANMEHEQTEAARLKAKLDNVQALMNQQWTGAAPGAEGVDGGGGGGGISAQLLDDLNAPLRKREQRQEAEAAARAANRAAHKSLGMARHTYAAYGDIASFQQPVLAAQQQHAMSQAFKAIDAALSSHIGAHSDDPAAPGDGGAVMPAPLGPPSPARAEGGVAYGGENTEQAEQGQGAEEGELSEVMRLKARLRRERDANKRLEHKLKLAQHQGFGEKYAEQLQQTEGRVADAVAKRLSPQVLKRAALEVARQVAAREASRGRITTPAARQQALTGKKERHSKSYESIARECDNVHEWECAKMRAKNTGPQPMHIAGSERFHEDEVQRKNIREGDDQDINYRFPREGTYPNRDGSQPFNGEKAAKDAKDADRNAKAAWAAAMVRDVRQGGGGDEEKGEEVADDAPRYRWVHHRNLVFRAGPSQNWAREAGSELPEQQQVRADEYADAHVNERDHLHISRRCEILKSPIHLVALLLLHSKSTRAVIFENLCQCPFVRDFSQRRWRGWWCRRGRGGCRCWWRAHVGSKPGAYQTWLHAWFLLRLQWAGQVALREALLGPLEVCTAQRRESGCAGRNSEKFVPSWCPRQSSGLEN